VDDVSDLTDLQNAIRDFADRRDWHRFHTPKNLAMAICGEAGELAAEFQWLTPEQSSDLTPEQLEAVRLEIADITIYLLRCADVLGVDVASAVSDKIALNEQRFAET
jgi:NTP pyrophosphatase (non-canonical NTP hydrolase)